MSDNAEFDKHITSVFAFAKAGYMKNALNMLEMMKTAYKEEIDYLNVIKAKILLGMGEEENFYIDQEKKQKYIEIYSANYALIKNYELCYGILPDKLSWFVLYSSSELVIAQNEHTGEVKIYSFASINYDTDVLADRPLYVEKILLKKQLEEIYDVVEVESLSAIYLGLEEIEAEILFQINDISNLISKNVFVFLIEERGITTCFSDNFFPFPVNGLNFTGEDYVYLDVLEELKKSKGIELEEKKHLIANVYKYEKKERDERVRNKHPRILFWSDIGSYTIPYQTRDEYYSATLLGCDCYNMIEPDYIRRITNRALAEIILDFKPDIIFQMNRFRFENYIDIPKEIIYVTWIQDPWPNILDITAKQKLKHRDILLNHLVNYREILGIYGDFLVDAPIPASQYIYRPYELTLDEQEKYGADICLVCMCTDPDGYVDELINQYEAQSRDTYFIDITRELLLEYKELALDGKFLYSTKEFVEYIKNGFKENGYVIALEDVEYLAGKMQMWYNQKLFRSVLVEWMLGAGFSNIKLWGGGWDNNPQYAKYAMGPAPNGKVLSKIFQASKIVLGNNIETTAAARAWECMLSGGFYLSNYIPPEEDVCDIRKYMPEGSFEMFHSKNELIEKLHFYLNNDDARREMARRGRDEALKRMTYDALMKKVIDIAPSYL